MTSMNSSTPATIISSSITTAAATTIATTTTLTSFKASEPVNNHFQQLADAYAAYADNFDLSLLPQDCNNPTENIPTTVHQYSNNTSIQQAFPQIKIEQTWPNQRVNEIKQEPIFNVSYEQFQHHQNQHHQQQQQQQQNQHQNQHHQQQQQQQQQQGFSKTSNKLTPPPAYPQLYPSPQSSPAQSEYQFPQTQYRGCYDSLSSSRTSLYPLSPCPSIDTTTFIKQEIHILPPSPPESNCEAQSPHSACSDIKTESLESEVEAWIDLNTLLEKSHASYNESNCQNLPKLVSTFPSTHSLSSPATLAPPATISLQQQDHQLLRECLEDTSFQQKNNLKPLALDTFIGGLEAVRGDIEPVISLALEHAKREADEMCAKLQISQDPSAWSSKQVHAWLRSTIAQFELPEIDDLEAKFSEDGAALILLTEDEFTRRIPEIGSTLHAQLDVWKMAFTDRCQNQAFCEQPLPQMQKQNSESCLRNGETTIDNNSTIWNSNCVSRFGMEIDEESDEDEDESLLPTTTTNNDITPMMNNSVATNGIPEQKRNGGRNGGSHIHLWQFLKELLSSPHINGTAIRWIDRNKGIFKIEDSVRVAKLWGRRKNRPAMNYDKLSRSIRQYYKKGIMKKTERSQRLVYQFCHPYHL